MNSTERRLRITLLVALILVLALVLRALTTDRTVPVTVKGITHFSAIDVAGPLTHATGTNEGGVFATYNTLTYANTTNKTMAIIPANANLLDVTLIVATLFNSSGTDVIKCGFTSGTPTEYANSQDAATAGVFRTGASATMPYASIGDVGAADITVYCIFAQSVADATTGAAKLIITWSTD